MILQTVSRNKSEAQFHPWKNENSCWRWPGAAANPIEIKITNNEEMKFFGKAINDKHPRTAMYCYPGWETDHPEIEGRNKNGGAKHTQEITQIFKDLGCWEALNLDGGGSSCMLVNGMERPLKYPMHGPAAGAGSIYYWQAVIGSVEKFGSKCLIWCLLAWFCAIGEYLPEPM